MYKSLILCALGTALLTSACGKKVASGEKDPVSFTQSMELFSQPIPPAGEASSPTQEVVSVDGRAITVQEVEREAGMIAARMRASQPPERVGQQRDAIVNQAIQNLIDRHLLSEAAREAQVEADPGKVDQVISQIKANLPPDTSLEAFLSTQGQTEESLRQNVEQELRFNQLLAQNVGELAPPSDDEIGQFYEQNKENLRAPAQIRVRHIFIGIQAGEPEEQIAAKRRRIHVLSSRIRQGETLEAVLASASKESDQEIHGGEMAIAEGRTPPELSAALEGKDPGFVTAPIQTSHGFHILELVERVQEHTVALEQAREQIARFLMQQRQQQAVASYLQSLRAKATIVPSGNPALQPPTP